VSVLSFLGGIHPSDKKELSKDKAIEIAPVPKKVIVPLVQHIGAPAQAIVSVGQEVKTGELIANAGGFVSASVHAPISGIITALTETRHPIGRMVPAIVIEGNGEDTRAPAETCEDYSALSADVLKSKVMAAGLVGMGGATFPTHVKLSPPKEKNIDTLIINGVECEPYLTSDYRLMLERPEDILAGTRILMKILGINSATIGIENNKPDAIAAMKKAIGSDSSLSVAGLKVKYPQGAEKMLIKAVAGREVPPRALPMDVGVVVQNVGTAIAVYEAISCGKPLIERVVTITGEGIRQPKNIMARIGTPLSDLLDMCGGISAEPVKIICGGPMMGFAQTTTDIVMNKGMSGIVVLPAKCTEASGDFGPCIRCGRCIKVCPMRLMPSQLGVLAEKGFYEDAKKYGLHDCFECGSCTYVCPSKRPIVQFVKLAKSLTKP